MTATFVVETGAVVAGANAYVTTAYVDQYNDDHEALTAWSGLSPDTVKEKHVRLATQYLELRTKHRLRGSRWDEDQALGLPRTDFEDYDGYWVETGSAAALPTGWKDACAYLAIRSAAGDKFLEPYSPEAENLSYSNEAKSESVAYKSGAMAAASTKRYPIVEQLIRPFVHNGALVEPG